MFFARVRASRRRRARPIRQLSIPFLGRKARGRAEPSIEFLRGNARLRAECAQVVKRHPTADDEDALVAQRRERAKCSAGSSPRLSESCTVGTSAFGYASLSGTKVPWSKPRSAFSALAI